MHLRTNCGTHPTQHKKYPLHLLRADGIRITHAWLRVLRRKRSVLHFWEPKGQSDNPLLVLHKVKCVRIKKWPSSCPRFAALSATRYRRGDSKLSSEHGVSLWGLLFKADVLCQELTLVKGNLYVGMVHPGVQIFDNTKGPMIVGTVIPHLLPNFHGISPRCFRGFFPPLRPRGLTVRYAEVTLSFVSSSTSCKRLLYFFVLITAINDSEPYSSVAFTGHVNSPSTCCEKYHLYVFPVPQAAIQHHTQIPHGSPGSRQHSHEHGNLGLDDRHIKSVTSLAIGDHNHHLFKALLDHLSRTRRVKFRGKADHHQRHSKDQGKELTPTLHQRRRFFKQSWTTTRKYSDTLKSRFNASSMST
ncbi:hypothetical protein J6590_042530 [Homalodisca vitripennis]|nr:hypothetical protein J6590_042530 [Homalodisca vitripennis]